MSNEESTISISGKVQDITESSIPVTRAKTKAGEFHLIPPLERFSRRGARKNSHKKKASRQSSTNSKKDTEGSLSDSQSSVESNLRTVAFPTRRWADYTSSSSSDTQMPVMVTEATTSDDYLQQMTLAIEKMTKSLEEKDIKIVALMTHKKV